MSRLFHPRPPRLQPCILVATREVPRNQLLVYRLAQTHLWRCSTERVRLHFAQRGYRISEPVRAVVNNTSWARMADTFDITFEDAGPLQVLHDLSVRQDGSVLRLLAVMRPHPGRDASSRDLVTMSSHNVGRLSWHFALRGRHRYSYAELLAQLRELDTFSRGEAWQRRVTILSDSLEP